MNILTVWTREIKAKNRKSYVNVVVAVVVVVLTV